MENGSLATVARRMANVLRLPARAGCRAVARFQRSRTIVLLYHSIGEARDAVSAGAFAEQMAYLKANATVVVLDRILDGDHTEAEGPLTCAITFDDGYAGVYDIAFPILKRHGFPAVLYVTTDAIGGQKARHSDACSGFLPGDLTLTWQQVTELSAHNFTIGSHLCTHKDMTAMTEAEGRSELCRSKSIIEQRLGIPCKHYAYPFGRFNRENVMWVRAAGYESSTTVVHATVPRFLDRFRIPRMCVAPIHTFNDFRAMLRGDFDYLPLVNRARQLMNIGY